MYVNLCTLVLAKYENLEQFLTFDSEKISRNDDFLLGSSYFRIFSVLS